MSRMKLEWYFCLLWIVRTTWDSSKVQRQTKISFMFYCTNGKRVRWKCHRNASTWYMIESLLVKNVDDSHTHIDRHFCFQFIRRTHCSVTFHYLTWENPIEILMRKTFLPCINYKRDLSFVSQYEIQKYVPKVLRVHNAHLIYLPIQWCISFKKTTRKTICRM